MERIDKLVLITFLVFCIVSTYTIMNTSDVTKAVNKCSSGIEVAQRCQCYPDKGIAKIFGKDEFYFELNNSFDNARKNN